jgi:sugar phosphate isomerase/epimerase
LALRRSWDEETAGLQETAPEAEKRGVVIGVENRDPHRWELAALARHGLPASELVTYHQGMRLDLLTEQIRQVASPNVGMCLDVGHAFLAAPFWPDANYLAAISQAAPWVRHVHFHDNYGRVDDKADGLAERLIFGEADSHMMPGWGKIPLAEVLAILKRAAYSGWLVVELRPRYGDYLAQTAATVRGMIGAG